MARDKLKVTIFQKTAEDNTYQSVDIDLFEYLQDADADDSILVVSDIRLPKGKGRPLPDLSKVNSDFRFFDTNDWRIDANSVLPSGISELFCLHSISSIGDLVGVLPASVQVVHVRNSIFNNIGKKEGLSIAKSFIEMYPDIIVCDERGQTLSERVQEKIEESKKTAEPVVQKIEPVQQKFEIKTGDWVSAEEFLVYIKKEKLLIGIDDADLKRYFQLARGKKSGLNIEGRIMQRADGVCVSCVALKDIEAIVNYIQQMQQQKLNDVKSSKKEPTKKEKKEEKVSQTAETDLGHVCWLDGKKIIKKEIKKYISKSVRNTIESACNSENTWLNVLKTIEKVNVNPVSTKGKKVFYIDGNGCLGVLTTLDFKNETCLCQALPNNDAARIIWAIKDDALVAIRYFPEHEGKARNIYKTYINSITAKGIPDVKTCYNVSKLIKDIEGPDGSSKTVKKSCKNAVNSSSEPVLVLKNDDISDNVTGDDVISEFVLVPTEEKVTTTEEVKVAANPVKQSVCEKPADANVVSLPKWVDVASVAYQIQYEYNIVKSKVDRVVRGIGEEKETAKKFKLATVLIDLLEQQKELEDKMQELKFLNSAVEKIQADLIRLKSK